MKQILTFTFYCLLLNTAQAQNLKEPYEGEWVADFDKIKSELMKSDWYKSQSKEMKEKALAQLEPYKNIVHIFTKTTSTMVGPNAGDKSTMKVSVTKIKENTYSINYSKELKALSIIDGDKMTQHTVFNGETKQTIYLKRRKSQGAKEN